MILGAAAMDATQKFVAELNVLRFMERLVAAQCEQRSLWTELLLAEIDKFDSLAEKKSTTEKCLQTCRTQLNNGRQRVSGLDPALPEGLVVLQQLEELEAVQTVILNYLGSLNNAR